MSPVNHLDLSHVCPTRPRHIAAWFTSFSEGISLSAAALHHMHFSADTEADSKIMSRFFSKCRPSGHRACSCWAEVARLSQCIYVIVLYLQTMVSACCYRCCLQAPLPPVHCWWTVVMGRYVYHRRDVIGRTKDLSLLKLHNTQCVTILSCHSCNLCNLMIARIYVHLKLNSCHVTSSNHINAAVNLTAVIVSRSQTVDRKPCGRVANVDSERVQPEERRLWQILHEWSHPVRDGERPLPGPSTRLCGRHPLGTFRDASERWGHAGMKPSCYLS